MNKRKTDGLLLIGLGFLPIASLIVFGSYKIVLKEMVESSHGATTSKDIYPEGTVSIFKLIEDNTGLDVSTQLISLGIFAIILIASGLFNFLPRNKTSQNKTAQVNPCNPPENP
jgi:hypothetical protein